MLEEGQFWRNRELRKHVAVIDGTVAPSIVFENSTYLNVFTKKWITANIWIYHDRIVYVGERMPENTEGTEIMECTGQYLVPGYIEPHAHPFQLYNPEEYGYHSASFGTTTLINDNSRLLHQFDQQTAFSFIKEFHTLPFSTFWWARYDSQTMLRDDEAIFNTNNILSWLQHPSVMQGGELTGWPQLLAGDDRLLYWIQETKRLGKRVEGHFPGASKNTLTKLKLLGASADHEAMTADEVMRRVELGYHVALRHSSIRPDLPGILQALIDDDFSAFDQLMFTTDGATSTFLERGSINTCIEIAVENKVPIEEAYRMASYHVAKYYGMDDLIGSIAPGRLAHINMLYEKNDPNPLGVLAKGKWLLKDGVKMERTQTIDWQHYGVTKAKVDWDLTADDLQFSIPVGLKMINDVIMKPYAVEIDITGEHLPTEESDAFLVLLDRHGKWRVNTVIHGFTEKLGAICSSFSTVEDLIIIGKNKPDMKLAFERMKEIGGGIILAHEGKILYELPLSLNGVMFAGDMATLMKQEKTCIKLLKEAGYAFSDPIFNLFFLSSTHLPYIRVTQLGIVDVLKREVIVPANMR